MKIEDIFQDKIYSSIIFSLWNKEKTSKELAEELIAEKEEFVIIQCRKCFNKNEYPLIEEIPKEFYNDVKDDKQREGVLRFRKFVKTHLYNGYRNIKCKKCKNYMLRYKLRGKDKELIVDEVGYPYFIHTSSLCSEEIPKNKLPRGFKPSLYYKSNIEKIKYIWYEFKDYVDSQKLKSKKQNLEKYTLKLLIENNFVKLNKSYYSINWGVFCYEIFKHMVKKIIDFLETKDTKGVVVATTFRKTHLSEVPSRYSDLKNKSERLLKNIELNIFQSFIKDYYNSYPNLNMVSEFIESFLISLGSQKREVLNKNIPNLQIFHNEFCLPYTKEKVEKQIEAMKYTLNLT